MKLIFNLASSTQATAGLTVSAVEFLHLEMASKMAFQVAIDQSIDLLGPDSPVWPHIASLQRDYGVMPKQAPDVFEWLLKGYLENCLKSNKPVADSIWGSLDKLFTAHSADKAFRRLVGRNVERLYGGETQENIDRFCNDVASADKLEWEDA